MSFLEELKRRNVVRVAAAYLALAWLIVQIVETLFPMYGISDAFARTVVTLVGLGLIPVVILAWVFELTPKGIRRDAEVDHDSASSQKAGRNLDRAFIVLLALGITYFVVDKFVLDPARDEAPPYLGGIATHPLFSPVHDDPRWQPFVQKAGQSTEQLAAIDFDLELPR
jgi:hypothetical protein